MKATRKPVSVQIRTPASLRLAAIVTVKVTTTLANRSVAAIRQTRFDRYSRIVIGSYFDMPIFGADEYMRSE